MKRQSTRSFDPPNPPGLPESPIRAANAVNGRQSNPVHSTWRMTKKRGEASRTRVALVRLVQVKALQRMLVAREAGA